MRLAKIIKISILKIAKQRIDLAIAGNRRWEASRRIVMATIVAISCPVGWKTVRSVKVSLLIVQVPVQTERLNPEKEEEEEGKLIRRSKNLSLCAVPYTSPLHVSVSAHTDAYVTSTRSYIRMRDRKPLPPSFLRPRHPPGTVPFPSSCALLYSRTLSKARKETQQK